MREIAIYGAIGLWLVVLLGCSVVTVRYRITRRFLIISWLGIPVRWLRLTNIQQITVQRRFWVEKWFNALSPGNRYLLIQKQFGLLFRHLAITPKNHLVFKADLEHARDQLLFPDATPLAAGTPAGKLAHSSSPSSAGR